MINELLIYTFDTPLGKMITVVNDEGLCLLEFEYRRRLNKEMEYLAQYYKTEIKDGTNRHTENVISQMEEYYSGARQKFDIPLITPGTDFQQKVWKKLIDIPYGQTRSYKAQSIALGNPDAVRAVARANGDNRIAVIIPCHRVIAENGDLTGYGGGLWRKQWLINHEKKISSCQLTLEM
jgi:AraC family transcriptional regulator, regulatory protein of adaptative response / methylated-DNA-[protein]-cysteine methyltransferase